MATFLRILSDVFTFGSAVASVLMGGNLPPVSRRAVKPDVIPLARPVATLAVVYLASVKEVQSDPTVETPVIAETTAIPAPTPEATILPLPSKPSKTAQNRRKARKPLPMPSAAQSTLESPTERLYVKMGRRYVPATGPEGGQRYRKIGDRYKLAK